MRLESCSTKALRVFLADGDATDLTTKRFLRDCELIEYTHGSWNLTAKGRSRAEVCGLLSPVRAAANE